MLSTVARTGSVLNLFTIDKPEWGVREAADYLGLPKSNTHELMASLSRIGLLRRTPSGRYRLGWRLLTISADLLGGSGFEARAHQVADEYAARLNQTVTVAAWDGLHVVCVASAAGRRDGEAVADGATLPGHATALGKLLMSSMPWETTMSIIDRYGLPRCTAATVASASELESQLEAARRTGLAHEYGEHTEGLACVATGIHDRGDLVAAVSVTAPVERMQVRREEYTAAVRGAARALLRPKSR
ncbi:IclR family transcriptional regulator [Rhodococcus sp. NPDC060086]|uniref:IclR family transcriptional regulator n=1 Tax=Rhodococcus sp. NPDC060086 TaxID=3347055 RepID=UPI00365732AE